MFIKQRIFASILLNNNDNTTHLIDGLEKL